MKTRSPLRVPRFLIHTLIPSLVLLCRCSIGAAPAALLVEINPESRVKVAKGVAAPELVEQGWRQFLVKVQNDAGVTAPLKAESPNAQKLAGSPEEQVSNRWLDIMMFDQQPLPPTLSSLKLEYRII